jgi:hypothetical protein
MIRGFISKDELCEIISVAGKGLTQAADEKDIYQIKNWIDYINEQFETLKQYESE